MAWFITHNSPHYTSATDEHNPPGISAQDQLMMGLDRKGSVDWGSGGNGDAQETERERQRDRLTKRETGRERREETERGTDR